MFRIRGIMLSVHASFALLLAYVASEGWQGAGWRGLLWSAATLCAFFVCVVLHELGHCFTARRFGVSVNRILLMPIGGMAEFDSLPRQPVRELLITLAGPAVNFVIAGLLWMLVNTPDTWVPSEVPVSIWDLLSSLFMANLVMGCFNFLPIFPMDGGRIFRALLALRLPYLSATFWAATVAKVLACLALLTVLGLATFHYIPWAQAGFTSALLLFIGTVGELELRATRRRELEEAHSRALYASYYVTDPTTEEPPVLIN